LFNHGRVVAAGAAVLDVQVHLAGKVANAFVTIIPGANFQLNAIGDHTVERDAHIGVQPFA